MRFVQRYDRKTTLLETKTHRVWWRTEAFPYAGGNTWMWGLEWRVFGQDKPADLGSSRKEAGLRAVRASGDLSASIRGAARKRLVTLRALPSASHFYMAYRP